MYKSLFSRTLNSALFCSKMFFKYVIIIQTFFLLSSCGENETNVSKGNQSGTLYWGNGTEPQSLDPQIATGVPEHHVISTLMEGLVLKDRKTLQPRPGMAESWEISDDGRVYTFKIRNNA